MTAARTELMRYLKSVHVKASPGTTDQAERGHGPTLLCGYRYAIKNKADYIFQTDSDGQTLPEEFEDFWIKRKRYDAVLGDRRDRQDGMSRVFVEIR